MQKSIQTIDLQRYPERTVSVLGTMPFAAFSLKTYVLCVDDNSLSDEELDRARGVFASRLADISTTEGENYLGFALIHKGTEGLTVSSFWWVQGCVLCHDHVRIPFNGVDPISGIRAHVLGCVWELDLIHFERNAWQQSMMQPQPNAKDYLKAWFKPADA